MGEPASFNRHADVTAVTRNRDGLLRTILLPAVRSDGESYSEYDCCALQGATTHGDYLGFGATPRLLLFVAGRSAGQAPSERSLSRPTGWTPSKFLKFLETPRGPEAAEPGQI